MVPYPLFATCRKRAPVSQRRHWPPFRRPGSRYGILCLSTRQIRGCLISLMSLVTWRTTGCAAEAGSVWRAAFKPEDVK